MARDTTYGRMVRFFHTHRYGRLAEIGFYFALGAVLALVGWWIYERWANLGLALIFWIVAASVAGFGLLPQKKPKDAPPPPGRKRAEIAEKVKASKAEKKRKGPPPPHPPIRRG